MLVEQLSSSGEWYASSCFVNLSQRFCPTMNCFSMYYFSYQSLSLRNFSNVSPSESCFRQQLWQTSITCPYSKRLPLQSLQSDSNFCGWSPFCIKKSLSSPRWQKYRCLRRCSLFAYLIGFLCNLHWKVPSYIRRKYFMSLSPVCLRITCLSKLYCLRDQQSQKRHRLQAPQSLDIDLLNNNNENILQNVKYMQCLPKSQSPQFKSTI